MGRHKVELQHDLRLIFRSIIRRKWCTVAQLNDAINCTRDKLKGRSKHDFPGEMKLKGGKAMRITGSMSQLKCLLRHLPLALRDIASNVPDGFTALPWKLLTTMVTVSWFLCSFALTEKQRLELDDTYHSYISLRLSLQQEWCVASRCRRSLASSDSYQSLSVQSTSAYESVSQRVGEKRKRKEEEDFLKPKHITLLRYTDLIKLLGPIALYSTTNAESRNGQLKKEINALGSYSKMLHTLKSVVERDEGRDYDSLDMYGIAYGDEFVKAVKNSRNVEMRLVLQEEDITMYRSLSYFGSTYTKGLAVAYYEQTRLECDSWELGLIEAVFSNDITMTLVVKKCAWVLDETLACLILTIGEGNDVVAGRQLAAHQPFSVVTLGETLYCPLPVMPTCF